METIYSPEALEIELWTPRAFLILYKQLLKGLLHPPLSYPPQLGKKKSKLQEILFIKCIFFDDDEIFYQTQITERIYIHY